MKFLTSLILLMIINGLISQDAYNYDSIVNIINSKENEFEKVKAYALANRPLLMSVDKVELDKLNKTILEKINPTDKKLFQLEIKLNNAKYLAFSQKHDSAEIALKAILIQENKKFITTYSKTIQMLGLLYNNVGESKKAISLVDEFVKTSASELSNERLSDMHYVKGLAFNGMNMLNSSTQELMIADSLLPPDNRGHIFFYHFLAENFGRMEDLEEAEKYLTKAVNFGQKLEDPHTQNLTNIQLGVLYQEQEKYAKSDSILSIANEFYLKNSNPSSLENILDLMSINDYYLKKYDASIAKNLSLLRNHKERNDSIRMSDSYQDITKAYLAKNDLTEAQKYMDSSYQYFIFNKASSEYVDLLELKKELNFLQKNYLQTIKINKEIDSLNYFIDKESNLNKLNELKYFYETEKKEKENLLLKTEKVEIENEKQKQFYQLLIGIIFLGLGLIVVYLLFKNREKKNEKLKELDTLKSKFFESISHELRTPLTLIQLPVSKALDEDKMIPKKDLKTIKYNAKRLQNLMDDLLSITRIEANKYPLLITENNITAQAKVLAAQFDSLAESNGIEYVKNIESQNIIGKYDKEVFNKVLINLISNAIKYSLNHGKVEVNFEVKNNQATLTVLDEGMGIKKEDQQYIFDKFYRVDQNNENIPGSGIGLSIVKELIEIIGGSISFESEEGKGTQFYVQFPIEEVQPSEITDKENYVATHKIEVQPVIQETLDELAISNVGKPHLLIVEDNQELLAYVKEQLSEDYKVFTANNGKLGIEKGFEIVPDLIISDWLMPEKNGIELCQAIKSNEITSHVPVVMLTAKTEVEDKVKGFETGADAYVAKPFDMNVLKAQVKNLIEQRRKLLEKYDKGDSNVSTKEFSERDIKFWNKLKKLVEENIGNPYFSVQSLSDQLFISRMQLNRKLKALINISGSDYIIKEKLNLAKQLLRNKDLQISEVAYQVGYDNVNSFGRAFKKDTGKTPSEFRKNL